jgi:hypothetical protein
MYVSYTHIYEIFRTYDFVTVQGRGRFRQTYFDSHTNKLIHLLCHSNEQENLLSQNPDNTKSHTNKCTPLMTTTPPTEEDARARLHYTEAIAPGLRMEMDLRRIICPAVESDYQKVEVLETIFGKVSLCGRRLEC